MTHANKIIRLLSGIARLRHPQHGYTLLEGVVTMTVIGIITAVSLSRLQGNSAGVQQRNAARIVVADLQYAQELAQMRGKAVRVSIDEASNSYAMYWHGSSQPVINPMGGAAFVRTFGKDEFLHVQISGSDLSNGQIIFAPDGAPKSGAGKLTAERMAVNINGKFHIVVQPETGVIKLVTL